jgi:polyphenol oxidase
MVLKPPFYSLDGQIAIDLPGARAVFTTQAWGDVRRTREEIGERLGTRLVSARQVHGNTVVQASSVTAETEADALIATTRGLAATVLAADCLPIVISGPGAAAAVHAGWRGLDSGVIASAARALRAHIGEVPLSAAIGPAAGPCCYEVGPELHERFAGFSVGNNLDLKAVARSQLQQAGVDEVHDVGLCTICSDPEFVFSYRRDGAAAGRHAAIAWLS